MRYGDEYVGIAFDKVQTFSEAMASPEIAEWSKAIDKEIYSLLSTNTLIKADLPADRRSISSKFVLKRKLGSEVQIVRYKARVVAHGNLQLIGIDFDETFAPVVDWEVTLVILTVMVGRKAVIVFVDFETAFLNGDIDEDVYITLPRGHDPHQSGQKYLWLTPEPS